MSSCPSVSVPPKRFSLFGYPIAHSAAPAFHNACFNNLALPHRFAGWSTSRITEEMLAEIRDEDVGGSAVTMPLKTAILAHLDDLTPAAQATQACNTIVKVRRTDQGCSRTVLVGTNTDVLGVRNALLRTLHQQLPDYTPAAGQRFPEGAGSALVIGGGATTRSAVYALHNLGLSPIFLVNRDAGEVALVIDSFSGKGIELVHIQSVADVEQFLGHGGKEQGAHWPDLAMVVGAIPAMAPTTPAEHLVYQIATRVFELPLKTANMASPASPLVLPMPTTPIFLDMAYKPRLTPLLRIAAARGWTTVGGVQAMIEQGLAQQRMWLLSSVDDSVACGGPEILGEDVENSLRTLVEGMSDVIVVGEEVDRGR